MGIIYDASKIEMLDLDNIERGVIEAWSSGLRLGARDLGRSS